MNARTPEKNSMSTELQEEAFEDPSEEELVEPVAEELLTAGPDGDAAAEAEEAPLPADRMDDLGTEVASLRDRLLRQAAEFQNYRRRVEQERQLDVKFGQALVLQQLLDVYDDLRRSIEAAEDAVEDENVDTEAALRKLLDGVELVFKKFTDELQRFGIEPIEAVGAVFDEREHEAMMAQPAPEGTSPGIVLAEVQKGYRMGDRVLRHSKVVVSG